MMPQFIQQLTFALAIPALAASGMPWTGAAASFADLETQFREMPMEARRLTGPLFWLHGDENETEERLREYIAIVEKGRNGALCTESRPHSDWLGPRWFRDVGICIDEAKKRDLKVWIFDDAWWPSQTMGNRVPEKYGAKRLVTESTRVKGGDNFELPGLDSDQLIKVIAAKETGKGLDAGSVSDLTDRISNGQLQWTAPAGAWQVMTFSWEVAPPAQQNGQRTVDGASRDCVDWFIETVYQPHYDHFGDDFGDTVVGYFYDEPETQGDWGTEVPAVLAERNQDYATALVAFKYELAGAADAAWQYVYVDALLEAWGRTMYGGMLRWCEAHDVASIGHFMDHSDLYIKRGLGAGNMFQMQKYSSMGGMDLVVRQLYPGQRKRDIYQLPKLTSSISHVYNKRDDLAMCEIFGAYGQDLTYPQMKWLCDQHQVRGVNFMITHSFNPKAPNDTDCPPYFYNDGQEPRWPLYRVWADYSSRLSLLLSGGRHVCPVALLFCGNSYHAGRAVQPENMTTALQDALYDCDWLPYDVFEDDAELAGGNVKLHAENYQALIVPPVEVIPPATLQKALDFLEAGGVVIGYGFLPEKSATPGVAPEEISGLCRAIWGDAQPGTDTCRTSAAGGKSFFLPEEPSPDQLAEVLAVKGGVPPVLEVLEGDTSGWLHVLHRVKDDRDVFLVCNQNNDDLTRRFRLRARIDGVPECWDAMRNTIAALPYETDDNGVIFTLDLAPMESALIIFQPEKRALPQRIATDTEPLAAPLQIARSNTAAAKPETAPLSLENASWVWYPEIEKPADVAPGWAVFRNTITLPENAVIENAAMMITADNHFILTVNGRGVGAGKGGSESWRNPQTIDVASALKPGENLIAIAAKNTTDTPSPAGLIAAYRIELAGAPPVTGSVDAAWRCLREKPEGWDKPECDDSAWPMARAIADFGAAPWGRLGRESIRQADPFEGVFTLDGQPDSSLRYCIEMAGVHEGVNLTVNGVYAGGAIGAPFRIDVTDLLKQGENRLHIEPYAPDQVRLTIYAG
jgi:hypothetical protein